MTSLSNKDIDSLTMDVTAEEAETFMKDIEPESFERRRTKGIRGRPVHWDFFFVPSDGNLYPSESAKMVRAPMTKAPEQRPSWVWALDYMTDHHEMWLVVQLSEGVTLEMQRHEAALVRGAVWKTGKTRAGIELASEHWDGRLWVRSYPTND